MEEEVLTKTCTHCNINMPATTDFFHKNKKGKYGLYPYCKKCRSKERRLPIEPLDPDSKRCSICKKIFPKNKDFFYSHNGFADNLDCSCKWCSKQKGKEFYERTKHTEKSKQTRRRGHEKRYAEKYDEILAYTNQYRRNRYRTDVEYRLGLLIRGRVKNAVNGKLRIEKTTELIGCSFAELKAHLESQFKDGMTWENYGQRGWHIDHIVPCAAFDLTDPIQQKQCFHYTNLQPLWCEDNQKKTCYYNGSLYKNGVKVTQL